MHTTPQAAPANALDAASKSPQAETADALRAASRLAASIGNDGSTEEHAAHLLLSALQPLTDRDDDADITLPAVALKSLLEELVNTLYDHRVTMRCVSAAIRDHLQATVGLLPNSETPPSK